MSSEAKLKICLQDKVKDKDQGQCGQDWSNFKYRDTFWRNEYLHIGAYVLDEYSSSSSFILDGLHEVTFMIMSQYNAMQITQHKVKITQNN